MKRFARTLNLDEKYFSSHSLRIGGATELKLRGASDSFIQAMGRWKSGAFIRYIRLTPYELGEKAKVFGKKLNPNIDDDIVVEFGLC